MSTKQRRATCQRVIELHHLTRRFDLPLRIEFAVNIINLRYIGSTHIQESAFSPYNLRSTLWLKLLYDLYGGQQPRCPLKNYI